MLVRRTSTSSPADALGKPRAERLQHRLLGGEAGGVVHFGVSMGVAIGPLGGRVHLLHEGWRAIDDLAHALRFPRCPRRGPLPRWARPWQARHRRRLGISSIGPLHLPFRSSGIRKGAASGSSAAPKETHSYSTVTDFARLRGWSTSQPRLTATARESSCKGTLAVMGEKASRTFGHVDDVVGVLGDFLVALGGHGDDAGTAGPGTPVNSTPPCRKRDSSSRWPPRGIPRR